MKETTVAERPQTAPAAPETREPERTLIPPVDIFEYEDGLAVVVDVPGVPKDGVEVSLDNDVLSIRATPRAPEGAESDYAEYRLMPYFRQFQLGEQVDRDKIQAEMRHGVLTIRLPKVEQAKPRKIAVEMRG